MPISASTCSSSITAPTECRAASNRTALAGPAGRLEALLEEPEDRAPRLAAVVCHPHPLYGGTMHNKVVYRLARGLRRAGAGGAALQLPRRGRQRGRARPSGRRNRRRARGARLAARALPGPAVRAGGLLLRLARHHAAGVPGGGRAVSDGAGLSHEHGRQRLPGAMRRAARSSFRARTTSSAPRPAIEALYQRLPEPKMLRWVEAADHFFAGALDSLEAEVHETAAGFGTLTVPS